DPLGAVHESPQGAHRGLDPDPEQRLERVNGAHLVRDRADAADPGDDVDDLVRLPADDQPLEVARRLEDLELGPHDVAAPDDEAQRALALDPAQPADGVRRLGGGGAVHQRSSDSVCGSRASGWFARAGDAATVERYGSAQLLNSANVAPMSSGGDGRPAKRSDRAATFAPATGPKQP